MRQTLALLACLLPAAVQAQPPAVWRTKVEAGQRTAIWSRSWGIYPEELELSGAGGRYTLPPSLLNQRSAVWWDWHYATHLAVPLAVPAGEYSLLHRGVAVAKLTVTRPQRPARLTRFNPGASPADIQAAWDRGDRVELRPGLYEWTGGLIAPPGAVLRGPGATVRFSGLEAIAPSDGLVLDGVTFEGVPGQTVAQNVLGNRPATNVSVVDCKLRYCFLGEFVSPGLLVEDCEFDHAGSNVVGSNTLYLRCRWFGLPPLGNHPWHTFGCRESAVVDCTFQHTDRGVICQTTRSDVADCYFAGLVMEGLVHSQGGCEGIGVEDPQSRGFSFRNNLTMHLRYVGDGHGYLLWNCRAANNLLRDATTTGGLGIELAGFGGVPQVGTELVEVEIRGGKLVFGPGATDTRVVRDWKGDPTVSVVGLQATRSNAFHSVAPVEWVPVQDTGLRNGKDDVAVRKDGVAVER